MAQNKIVEVEISQDNAVLLLEAAQRLDQHVSVVETTSEGVFRVPEDVAKAAGLGEKGSGPSQSKVDKARETVVDAEPQPFGDPQDGPERPVPSNTITTAQADAEINALNHEVKSGEKRTPAKRTAAKRTAAKKAASTQQKSE